MLHLSEEVIGLVELGEVEGATGFVESGVSVFNFVWWFLKFGYWLAGVPELGASGIAGERVPSSCLRWGSLGGGGPRVAIGSCGWEGRFGFEDSFKGGEG